MKDSDLRANCRDYCWECRSCHTSASRDIQWGEISPPCRLGTMQDSDYEVPCKNDHPVLDYSAI